MNNEQFEFYFSPSYFTHWQSKRLPSVIVDYSWENREEFAIEFIAFRPEDMTFFNWDLLPQLKDEILSCVEAKIIEEITGYNDWLHQTMKELGLNDLTIKK